MSVGKGLCAHIIHERCFLTWDVPNIRFGAE